MYVSREDFPTHKDMIHRMSRAQSKDVALDYAQVRGLDKLESQRYGILDQGHDYEKLILAEQLDSKHRGKEMVLEERINEKGEGRLIAVQPHERQRQLPANLPKPLLRKNWERRDIHC